MPSQTQTNGLPAGLDMEAFLSVGKKIRPDPLTGKAGMQELTQYIMNNLDDPDVMKMLNEATGQLKVRDAQKTGLGEIDCKKLPIQKHTIWLVKLQFGGMQTADGKPVGLQKAASLQGVRQTFHLHSWIKIGPGMAEDTYRMMEEYVGMPSSKQIEDFIRGSMATPFPGFDPCLPQRLILSSNLAHHKMSLQPFLNSLPKPFSWEVAPAELEGMANDAKYEDEKLRFTKYMKLAKEKKDVGNQLYADKNATAAIKSYEDAIEHLDRALSLPRTGDDDRGKEATSLMAICYANCSIARLLAGGQENKEKALEDAENATEIDPSYYKGYIRLSRAYDALGKTAEAEEAISRALHLPQLQNNQNLVDHLISIQKGKKGLPSDSTCTTQDDIKK